MILPLKAPRYTTTQYLLLHVMWYLHAALRLMCCLTSFVLYEQWRGHGNCHTTPPSHYLSWDAIVWLQVVERVTVTLPPIPILTWRIPSLISAGVGVVCLVLELCSLMLASYDERQLSWNRIRSQLNKYLAGTYKALRKPLILEVQ